MIPLTRFGNILFSIILACAACIATDAAETIPLNRGWLFQRGDIAGAENPEFNSAGWETINVPHDFQISQDWVAPTADEIGDANNPVANIASRLSSRGFKEMGSGWYRKILHADPA